MSNKEKSKDEPARYAKKQFLGSRQRAGAEKDILAIVLEDGKTYTLAEANKLVEDFKKRKVK